MAQSQAPERMMGGQRVLEDQGSVFSRDAHDAIEGRCQKVLNSFPDESSNGTRSQTRFFECSDAVFDESYGVIQAQFVPGRRTSSAQPRSKSWVSAHRVVAGGPTTAPTAK